jgi:hypothetical protein
MRCMMIPLPLSAVDLLWHVTEQLQQLFLFTDFFFPVATSFLGGAVYLQ